MRWDHSHVALRDRQGHIHPPKVTILSGHGLDLRGPRLHCVQCYRRQERGGYQVVGVVDDDLPVGGTARVGQVGVAVVNGEGTETWGWRGGERVS